MRWASACIKRPATATSLKTQKPEPLSAVAWWVPPPRWTAKPSAIAARAAAMVAPTDRLLRSTMDSLHGHPISRCAAADSVPAVMAVM